MGFSLAEHSQVPGSSLCLLVKLGLSQEQSTDLRSLSSRKRWDGFTNIIKSRGKYNDLRCKPQFKIQVMGKGEEEVFLVRIS